MPRDRERIFRAHRGVDWLIPGLAGSLELSPKTVSIRNNY